LFLLFIILIVASVVAILIDRRKNGKKKKEADPVARKALAVYKDFAAIYPARVYSPVAKSLEVALLANCDFKYPSLEIAVGDGYLSSLIFKDKNQKLAIGNDMIYETILSAKKYGHIERFAIFEAQEIPLPDNCLETVLMLNLMHHLPSRKRAMGEAARVLKPGGKFIFTDNLYGWVQYTFDSRILRFFHLDFIAKKIENFKLNLFAQKLLISPAYWEEAVKGTQMEVVANQPFVSRRAMTIGSIFEYFNLLQGQPTRESMKFWLKIKFINSYIQKLFHIIIEDLIINEKEYLKKADGAYLFVVLTKKK